MDYKLWYGQNFEFYISKDANIEDLSLSFYLKNFWQLECEPAGEKDKKGGDEVVHNRIARLRD